LLNEGNTEIIGVSVLSGRKTEQRDISIQVSNNTKYIVESGIVKVKVRN
jgi:hypothetical protein